jgi:SAM-dependent methyltransferase
MSDKLFGFYERKTLSEPANAVERIVKDGYLRQLFSDELSAIRSAITAANPKKIIEIGAAGGITKVVWPEVETTDVRVSPGVDFEMSAEKIQAEDNSVDVLFGMDALHHARDPRAHFIELNRVLKQGGNAIYIEPNWNLFSRLCFKILLKYLHPEPYDTKQEDWEIKNDDPMMGNQAQVFNIFVRDKAKFQKEFPKLRLEVLQPLKGISFLLSGGVHTRLPIPSALLLPIYRFEVNNQRWISAFGLGRVIRLTKI